MTEHKNLGMSKKQQARLITVYDKLRRLEGEIDASLVHSQIMTAVAALAPIIVALQNAEDRAA